MEDDDWLKTVGIGGLIIFLYFVLAVGGSFVVAFASVLTFGVGLVLFVPLFLVLIAMILPIAGFYIRVLRTTIEGDDAPPKFRDWGGLFKEGAYSLGIGLAYQVPMIVLGGGLIVLIVLLSVVAGSGDAGAAGSALLGIGQLVFYLVAFLWSIVTWYLAPISLSVYATEDSLRSAFSVDRIKPVATSKEYAVPWVVGFVGIMVANNVAGFLTFVVVGALIQFYVVMVGFRLFGKGYAAALEAEEATPGATPTAESPR